MRAHIHTSRHRDAMRTPVNVITGALGAGKTTLIGALARMRPEGETWAIIVNDFGALGLDAALLDDVSGALGRASEGSVVLREVQGGCACCASSAALVTAIAQTIRRHAPARVLVEPSGLGDAGRIVDALRGEYLRTSVDVRATVCVVDVREFGSSASGVREGELFRRQSECADALCGTHADVASESDIAGFFEFGESFWPKKQDVFLARDRVGGVDLATLDAACGWESNEQTEEKAATTASSAGPFEMPMRLVANGTPWMVKNDDGAHASCGYAFHADDVFMRPALRAFFDDFILRREDIIRFKGVLRLGADWARPEIVKSDGGEERNISFTESSYRRDSRFELIRRRGVDASADASETEFFNDIRDRLLACRKPPRANV